jgi:ABC-type transport system involved in cytochrome c biogenesis permease component
MVLLILPLNIPILIFGTGLAQAGEITMASSIMASHVTLLLSLWCIVLPLALWSSAYAIKYAVEQQ